MDQLPVHSADISTPDGTIRAGETLDGLVPPLSVLPEHFRSLVYMVSKELHFAARETYELLRWTGSSYGSNRTLGSRPQQWSLTGQEWSFLPFEYSAHLRAEGGLPLQPP